MSAGALERIVRRTEQRGRAAAAEERCDLCNLVVPERHRHMVDMENHAVLCVCRACAVLFDRDGAGDRHYRLIPEQRRRVSGVAPAQLGVPVGLAYFVRAEDGEVRAHYPSPAGATRWEVDGGAWREAVRRCPELDGIAAEVEALLVNTSKGRSEAWVVPLDDCYRLVAVVRQHWRGLYGGERVWAEINSFFEALRRHDGSHQGR